MKGSLGNYHKALSVKSVSNFVNRYMTQQCVGGAAKPQGSAKVCSSVHCMHLRWEVATFVIDDEQSTYFQMKIWNGVTLAIVQQLKCNDYFTLVWIITAQVYNIVPCGGSTLVCHNFERLLPAQTLWSYTAHMCKLKSYTLQHMQL